MTRMMTVALAAAISTGCTAGTNTGTAAPGGDSRPVVEVENHNWLDATVYAVTHGMRHRLGTVTTNDSRRFVLPSGAVSAQGEVQLMIDLIGAPTRYVSPVISVRGGDLIEFAVENHLPLSNFMVMSMRR